MFTTATIRTAIITATAKTGHSYCELSRSRRMFPCAFYPPSNSVVKRYLSLKSSLLIETLAIMTTIIITTTSKIDLYLGELSFLCSEFQRAHSTLAQMYQQMKVVCRLGIPSKKRASQGRFGLCWRVNSGRPKNAMLESELPLKSAYLVKKYLLLIRICT